MTRVKQIASLPAGQRQDALKMYRMETGQYVVVDTITNKSIVCASYSQGMDILARCVENYSNVMA